MYTTPTGGGQGPAPGVGCPAFYGTSSCHPLRTHHGNRRAGLYLELLRASYRREQEQGEQDAFHGQPLEGMMSSEKDRAAVESALYVAWVDYGCDGWHPYPYQTLAEAVAHDGYGSYKIVTKQCLYTIGELPPSNEWRPA